MSPWRSASRSIPARSARSWGWRRERERSAARLRDRRARTTHRPDLVDGAGDTTHALVGGLMRTTALHRRIAGFVIDGALRDVAEWAEGGMPAFAAGNSLRGPGKDGPGEINVPVTCAGLAVQPGDVVVGDADGVIAVAPPGIGPLLERCRAKPADEERVRQQNASGATDEERIDAYLRSRGVQL
ncbi:RraA family protein [Pseudonocardia sichuanensis]